MTDSKQGFEDDEDEKWLEAYVPMWGTRKVVGFEVVEGLKKAYQAGREHQREVDAGIAEGMSEGYIIDNAYAACLDIAKAIREAE